ncbi:golgin subfamily member protein [Salix suchowensis]|nr:golgin subfamily member protein [Salix suchowensis]
METKHAARRHSIGSLQRRRMCKLKRKNSERKLSRSIEKIRADMVEISEGQKRIRQGQTEVREKFEKISVEAAKLKEETNQICKQSAANQNKLDLMFQIVKARAEKDSAKDAFLTQKLRDLMGKQNTAKTQVV